MGRRSTRELAMKLLYQYSITGEINENTLESIKQMFESEELEDVNFEYVEAVLNEFPQKREEIDDIISFNSHSWKIDRISKVDLAILRLALLEMLCMDQIPVKVSINEAVEMAKKYSTDKSHRYINGLLGGYLKSIG